VLNPGLPEDQIQVEYASTALEYGQPLMILQYCLRPLTGWSSTRYLDI
jgi:hypothetical protein